PFCACLTAPGSRGATVRCRRKRRFGPNCRRRQHDPRGQDGHMLMLRPARLAKLVRLAGILAIALSQTGHAKAQGAVKSVHADWQIRCDTPPGAQAEQCALIQSVTAEDRANIGLTVIVLKTADNKSRLMRVIAPL